MKLTVGRGAALRDVPGAGDVTVSFETADIDRHKDLVADVFDRARAERPGWASRPDTPSASPSSRPAAARAPGPSRSAC